MDYDLLIRNGRMVDGSGLPSYIADVGIKDGKIVDIGRLKSSAARTIDADGLVVSPGFIDHHTHMDGQILWDPYGTCEPQHGVTSIIMGNCGLALAPVKPGGEDAIIKSFVRVEAIPRVALEKTIKACAPEWAEDYPAATKRLIQRSEGICQTIVNGQVIYEDGKLSGEMPGQVLRGTAYQA